MRQDTKLEITVADFGIESNLLATIKCRLKLELAAPKPNYACLSFLVRSLANGLILT